MKPIQFRGKETMSYNKSEIPETMTAEAEDILFNTMTDAGFSYVSFPAFVENESSVDVFDIACRAMEAYAAQQKEMIAADMYPKEFVEWKEVANVLILPPNERYKEGRRYRMDVVGEDYKKVYHLTFYGIDELFNYWLKNMKKS